MFGENDLQHSVSEKFEGLVIKMMALRFVSKARMSQRFGQKQRISEFISDSLFQGVHQCCVLKSCHGAKMNAAREPCTCRTAKKLPAFFKQSPHAFRVS